MNKIDLKKIIIARHYGFCMGVKRAIAIAEESMGSDDRVTILNEIVHNDAVVERFRRAGVGLAKAVEEIDCGTVIISAHGVSPEVYERAERSGLAVIDATCPLVLKIHKIIKKLADDGYTILHYGDPDHDETIGIVGHAPDKVIVIPGKDFIRNLRIDSAKVALTSQTTARSSDFEVVEHLVKKKYPATKVFNTICNATSQRQSAVLNLAPKVDLMLVVGSRTSANSNRLVQISKSVCPRSYLIDSADDIDPEWFTGEDQKVSIIGITAGASTPDFLIEGAIEHLKIMAGGVVEVVYPPKKANRNKLALKDNTFQ